MHNLFSQVTNEEEGSRAKGQNYVLMNNLLKDALNGKSGNFSELNDLLGNPKDFDFFALNTKLVSDLMLYTKDKSAACVISGEMGLGKCVSACFVAAKLVTRGLYINSIPQINHNVDGYISRVAPKKMTPEELLNQAIFRISEIELDVLRRIIMNIHPDVLFLDATSDITIENAIEIRKFIASPGLLSTTKVVIINNAYRLNHFSSNALLKDLEDLHDNVYIFFITSNRYLLLNTILSRCFSVQALPNNDDRVDHYLKTFREFNIMENNHKNMFISYLKNAPGKAKNILSNAVILNTFLKLYSIFTIYIPDNRLTENYQTRDEVFISKVVNDLLKYEVSVAAIEDFILYIIGLPEINNIRNDNMEAFSIMKEKCLATFLSIRTMNVDKKSFIVSLILSILYLE